MRKEVEAIAKGDDVPSLKRSRAKSRQKILFFFTAAPLRWGLCAALAFFACSPDPADILLPAGDIKPPSIIEAGQSSPDAFRILFDENVEPIEKSFAFDPPIAAATPQSSGALLTVLLQPAVGAGVACSLSGEARDPSGNTTRFLFSFVGYNDNPAELRLNEIQTGKNSSASNPHRDYIEFLVGKGGNIGGIQITWASSVKVTTYTFPPCEVATNSIIVLHCAPEGIPTEVDETEQNLAMSEGIDANASGRDFWTMAGGLPDETGAIMLSIREGDEPIDGVFYASVSKAGEVDSAKLAAILEALSDQGIWPCSTPPLWEEGFLWKSSTARPLHRKPEAEAGPDQWLIGDAGSQSPGSLEPKASRTKKSSTNGK